MHSPKLKAVIQRHFKPMADVKRKQTWFAQNANGGYGRAAAIHRDITD